MILTDLKIHHLRNIELAQVELSNTFTFIIGPNGSGKTSVLEALYLLSCGHSFRSREIAPLITQGESVLTVFTRAQSGDTISIQKSNSLPTQIKLSNQPCHSTSQLAYALPCQVFYSDIFEIMESGSSERRAVLDWGLFHVKQEYLSLWKTYKKVLKQRNALLKSNAPYSQFIPWDNQLSQLAEQLHAQRLTYFMQWELMFTQVLSELTQNQCVIRYFKGWDRKESGKALVDLLEESFISDKQKTYTQYGAHQADILFESHETKAKRILSRGQQKIILIALKLAQARLLDKPCLYLFDDLPAELDEVHQKKLFDYLAANKSQSVITSTYLMNLPLSILKHSPTVYRLESGTIVSRETMS